MTSPALAEWAANDAAGAPAARYTAARLEALAGWLEDELASGTPPKWLVHEAANAARYVADAAAGRFCRCHLVTRRPPANGVHCFICDRPADPAVVAS